MTYNRERKQMAKSTEHRLFGVRSFNYTTGLISPYGWVKLRCKEDEHGFFKTPEGVVMWFYDFGVRDEFSILYGGEKVTLTRKVEFHVADAAIRKLREIS
jgi:hypothetical protein